MQSTLVTRDYVVHGESGFPAATILAGIIIAAEDFAARQLDMRARPVNLQLEADYGGAGNLLPYSMNVSAAICHERRFTPQDQNNSPTRRANVNGLEVRIQD